jgi:hypothetical protein
MTMFSFSYKFKAKPFDRRLIECDGMYGVKKPEETITTTKPKPFVFESDERLEARKDKVPAENEVCRFSYSLTEFCVSVACLMSSFAQSLTFANRQFPL